MSYMANFRRRNHRAVLVVALALPVVLAGWVSGHGHTRDRRRHCRRPTDAADQGMKPQQSIGKGEGQLNLIAWEGYTQAQWVKPFERQTGCTVNAKYAGSSSEMVSLMANGGGGQYDLVSASGDADLRLIYGGAVKPVNIKLIPSWKQFRPFLQSPAFNTINGAHYGVSLQFGPNDLLYSTKAFPKAPTSWSVIYSKSTPARSPSQTTRSRSPTRRSTFGPPASLGITDPYELTQPQFNAAVNLLEQQRPLIKKYWNLASDEIFCSRTARPSSARRGRTRPGS